MITFTAYVGIVAVALIIVFVVIRAIDYGFGRKEAMNEHLFNVMEMNDQYVLDSARERAGRREGYQYNKQLVQSFTDRQKAMSQDLIKQINDSMWEYAKKMMEGI